MEHTIEYIKGFEDAKIAAARIITDNYGQCITQRQIDIMNLKPMIKVAIEARRQHEQHESTGTPLSDHFSPFICKQLKHSFGIDKVEQAKNLQDFELMRVQGLGKMFIQKLRKL